MRSFHSSRIQGTSRSGGSQRMGLHLIMLIEETGPTQTPQPVTSDPKIDRITQSIRTHLKLHFDTPGGPQSESLNQLALGMNKKKAAQLFYQTCGE
ncbi:putative rad21/Rec8-like protein [Dioscorea sansibarensis]